MLLDVAQPGILDKHIWENTQKAFDNLIKPVGSLARLEDITCLYAAARRKKKISSPAKKVLVFASDHGVAQEGNFLYTIDDSFFYFQQITMGNGAINILGQKVGAGVLAVNLGLKKAPDIEKHDYIAAGTRNILHEPAMCEEQFSSAFSVGRRSVKQVSSDGVEVIGLGSLGSGAEVSDTALLTVLLGSDKEFSLSDEHENLLDKILHKHSVKLTESTALEKVCCLGGFEIPALMGAIVEAAHMSMPVFLDGIASLLAAKLAVDIHPDIGDFLVPVATTIQPGQEELLQALGLSTMLDLKLPAGGGEGGMFGFDLLEAGIKALNEMDSFGSDTVHGPLGDFK